MTKPLVPVANVEVVLGCAWAAVDSIAADMTAMIVAATGRRTARAPCASQDWMPCQNRVGSVECWQRIGVPGHDLAAFCGTHGKHSEYVSVFRRPECNERPSRPTNNTCGEPPVRPDCKSAGAEQDQNANGRRASVQHGLDELEGSRSRTGLACATRPERSLQSPW